MNNPMNTASNQSDEDENLVSRIKLKRGLQQIPLTSEEFDISQFTESRNELQKYTKVFPTMNAPTLESNDSATNQHIRYLSKKEAQPHYTEDLTARHNEPLQKLSHHTQTAYAQKLQKLSKQLAQKNIMLNLSENKNKSLQERILKYEKQLLIKEEIIKSQKKQLFEKKQIIAQNTPSSSQSSLIQQNIMNFCPQMLSPEQTMLLLTKLLKKVSKSARMVKAISVDENMRQIFSKISRVN